MEKKFEDGEKKDKKVSTVLKNILDRVLEGNKHEPGCVYIKLIMFVLCFYFLGLVFYHLLIK